MAPNPRSLIEYRYVRSHRHKGVGSRHHIVSRQALENACVQHVIILGLADVYLENLYPMFLSATLVDLKRFVTLGTNQVIEELQKE